MQAPTSAKDRRRLGVLLLLAGIVLAAVGFFLPWLRYDCIATCAGYSWPIIRSPVGVNGLFLFACWPAWFLALVCAILTVVVEIRPGNRDTAIPALLLAGMLLVVQAFAFLLTGFTGFSPAPRPVLSTTLLPGVAVGPLGALLVAIGGWFRYHPQRLKPPRELTQVPAER